MTDRAANAWSLIAGESAHWLMSPVHLSALVQQMSQAGPQGMSAMRRHVAPSEQSVAVIPLIGPLVRRGGFLATMFGFASYDSIRDQVARAVQDKTVTRLLVWTDSPGGSATGCEETSAVIADAARVKPVSCFVDGMCCSAALWSVAGVTEIVATPSSELGSVGVFAVHGDHSKQLENDGVSISYIVSRQSPQKVDGNAANPLSERARAKLQEDVDKLGDRFVAGVAKGRGLTPATVLRDFGQGASMFSDQALSVRMIDRIGDFASVLRTTPTIIDRERQSRRARLEAAKFNALTPAQVERRAKLERLKADHALA